VLDAPDANALFASDIVRGNGASIAETINQLESAAITDLNSEWALALPSYSDQVLPFNVTLAGANEYGAMCASKDPRHRDPQRRLRHLGRRRRHRVPGDLRGPRRRTPAGDRLAVPDQVSPSRLQQETRARARGAAVPRSTCS
jgi:hypothetical protein